jgi:hypothetical protein
VELLEELELLVKVTVVVTKATHTTLVEVAAQEAQAVMEMDMLKVAREY